MKSIGSKLARQLMGRIPPEPPKPKRKTVHTFWTQLERAKDPESRRAVLEGRSKDLPIEWKELDARSYQMALLFAVGWSVLSVSERMNLSPDVVDKCQRDIWRTLNVVNNVLLARKAIRDGLVQLDKMWDVTKRYAR